MSSSNLLLGRVLRTEKDWLFYASGNVNVSYYTWVLVATFPVRYGIRGLHETLSSQGFGDNHSLFIILPLWLLLLRLLCSSSSHF